MRTFPTSGTAPSRHKGGGARIQQTIVAPLNGSRGAYNVRLDYMYMNKNAKRSQN